MDNGQQRTAVSLAARKLEPPKPQNIKRRRVYLLSVRYIAQYTGPICTPTISGDSVRAHHREQTAVTPAYPSQFGGARPATGAAGNTLPHRCSGSQWRHSAVVEAGETLAAAGAAAGGTAADPHAAGVETAAALGTAAEHTGRDWESDREVKKAAAVEAGHEILGEILRPASWAPPDHLHAVGEGNDHAPAGAIAAVNPASSRLPRSPEVPTAAWAGL